MKNIFILILSLIICLPVLSNPLFKNIPLDSSDFKDGYYKMLTKENKIYLFSSDFLYILNSNFNIIKKIKDTDLYDLVKKDLELPENIKDTLMLISNGNFDNNGKLWVSTTNGVFIFEDTTLTKIYHSKNSNLLVNDIHNVQFAEDTAILNPTYKWELYYLYNENFTKVSFPIDSEYNTTKFLARDNSLQFNNKYYYIGFRKNLIEKDDDNFIVHKPIEFTNTEKPIIYELLKENSDTIYFFEYYTTLKLIKFCNGNFSSFDFVDNNIIPKNDSCLIYFYDFDFDKDNNLWAIFNIYDTITNYSKRCLLKYKDGKNTLLYYLDDIIENNVVNKAFDVINIDKENNLFYGFNSAHIFKYDMSTGIEETCTAFPNLYLLNIYPNPVKNKFKLEFSTLPTKVPDLKVNIYNYFGIEMGELMTVITYNSSTGIGTIESDVLSLPNGLYIITLSNGDYTRSCKIIVQH